jgi:hypothetical protein
MWNEGVSQFSGAAAQQSERIGWTFVGGLIPNQMVAVVGTKESKRLWNGLGT